ncbi:hypothetical protein CFC21_068279 [Triticum aestivum]|uniref:Uncharacterized protein n=2 Tax=Triticum aestivum TaxID=4565 RepID=A0A3B6KRD5_WHEAT|nr:hypothetical protein CFC21_068279 [Triticum aestivum]
MSLEEFRAWGEHMRAMADHGSLVWAERMAAAMAGGDEKKMNMLRVIYMQYKDEEDMRRESRMVVRAALKEEQIRIKDKSPLEIIYWAMEEGKYYDMRRAWWKREPDDWFPSYTASDGVRVVIMTARSPPRSRAVPVVTVNGVRVVPRRKVARVVSQLPRRSPRFPRRSARIQALARSAGDE